VSEDWKVGDLAVCVDAGPSRRPATWVTHHRLCSQLREGTAYLVEAICITAKGEVGLVLRGFDYRTPTGTNVPGWNPARFRKIRPDEHEDCEPEFVELLKRSKKRVSA
jgi:hypothetical protein